MAVNKKDISGIKAGMNRDSSPTELKESEYTFALNVNLQSENATGRVIVQNEPSNVLCSGFKDGYKVIGHKYDNIREKTYFFLTNPDTGFSEIGFINSFYEDEILTPTEQVSGGVISVVLETPLENITQVAKCVYTTLISDYCATGS